MRRTERPCPHDRGHVIDSRFHGDGYATADSRRVFCDVCRLQRWLDVEANLALSQADVGLIPRDMAAEIVAVASVDRIDLEAVRRGMRETQHSLVALLRALAAACGGGAGEFVHHGATTQDIQDTAQALEMGDVLDLAERDLRKVLVTLKSLAVTHRETLMVGRTHARPALPTTFGLKVAGWIDELLRHAERIAVMRPRVLVAELHGGVGTMAGFQGKGRELLGVFAERLGLGRPSIGWHVARDRVAEFATVLAMLTATLARIADEVRILGRPEFGEVEEDWRRGHVGSSTMPHKRNPEACEQVVVLARLARSAAATCLEAMLAEHERDSRGLRLEWPAVAEVSHYSLAALNISAQVLSGLKVHAGQMAAHVDATAEALCTEALMLALGAHVGKQSAYALVYELSQRAQDEGGSLRTSAASHPAVRDHLTPRELEEIFDPARQVGEAPALVMGVVAELERYLASPPDATQGEVSVPGVAVQAPGGPG